MAVIFKYSGQLDFILAIIFSVFLFYVIKIILFKKYQGESPDYEIRGLLNDTEDVTEETFINLDTDNNREELYKI